MRKQALEKGQIVAFSQGGNADHAKRYTGRIKKIMRAAVQVTVTDPSWRGPRQTTVRFNDLVDPETNEKFSYNTLKKLNSELQEAEQSEASPEPVVKDEQPKEPLMSAKQDKSLRDRLEERTTNGKQMKLEGGEPVIIFPEGDVRVITLDQTWAELLLQNNHPQQRKADPRHIDRIVRALVEGEYVWLGDPIRIDKDDYLVDGQHRCHAVLKSGIAMPNQLLVKTRTPDAILYIDAVHKLRTPKDVQRISGQRMTHSTVDSAIIMAWAGFVPASNLSLSTPERLRIIQQYPFLDELHSLYARSRASGVRLTAGPLAVASECLKIDKESALIFFGAIANNSPWAPNGAHIQPAETFTRWFLRVKSTGQPSAGGTAFMVESADKAAHAWNAWRSGRVLTKLQGSKDGKVPALV